MNGVIKVGMADLNVTSSPGILITLGLGSCVGIVLYDDQNKIGGMAHIMLPTSRIAGGDIINEAKFADTAIEKLMELMIGMGAKLTNITAKLAGGAQMFASRNGSNDVLKIGQKNVEQTLKILQEKDIKVVAQDTGGNYGRTIELYSETGALLIKTIGHGVKQI
jgi:chemotaxis protein CheD